MDLKRSSNEGESSSSKKHKLYSNTPLIDSYGSTMYSPSFSKTNPHPYNGPTKGSENTPPGTGKPADDRQDTEQLQDALVSAGVDIKEEEHNMSRSYEYAFASNTLTLEEDRTKMTDFLNPIPLNDLIYRIAVSNSLKTIDPDIAPLLALSLRNRMAGLLSDMIVLSKHRTASPPVNRRIIDNEIGIITIRDALNVLEMDKEGAGEIFGRGARALSRDYLREQIILRYRV
ncbi:hypothetical protein PCK2_000254 [Pneumocystis canis]|nr:hypothetical protein PCK2_000254 [Pneumocystis canis]